MSDTKKVEPVNPNLFAEEFLARLRKSMSEYLKDRAAILASKDGE